MTSYYFFVNVIHVLNIVDWNIVEEGQDYIIKLWQKLLSACIGYFLTLLKETIVDPILGWISVQKSHIPNAILLRVESKILPNIKTFLAMLWLSGISGS